MVLERSRTGLIPDVAASPAASVTDPTHEAVQAPDPAGSVVVALAQCYPKLGDVASNLASHLATIGNAAARAASLVVFPELSMTGYFLKDQVPDVALRLDSDEIGALREASREGWDRRCCGAHPRERPSSVPQRLDLRQRR